MEFAKKVIFTPLDKNIAVTQEVLLSNPDSSAVVFVFDDSALSTDRVFSVLPLRGRVDSG